VERERMQLTRCLPKAADNRPTSLGAPLGSHIRPGEKPPENRGRLRAYFRGAAATVELPNRSSFMLDNPSLAAAAQRNVRTMSRPAWWGVVFNDMVFGGKRFS
jgi:hypothetical protein